MARHAEDFLLRQYPNSPYWYYKLKGWKSYKSTGEKTKAGAKRIALAKWVEADGNTSKIKFGEFAKDFYAVDSPWSLRQLDREKMRVSTIEWRQRIYKTHIKDFFAPLYLDEIDADLIDAWLMGRDGSGQTKNHIRSTLNIIFQEAVRKRIIRDNPVVHVEPAKINPIPNEPPTMAELKLLFPDDQDKFNELWPMPMYGVMCEVTATTGLRMQEVRALTPAAIKFDLQGILVTSAVKVDGEIDLPKADEIRAVLIPEQTIQRLKWWIFSNQLQDGDYLFQGRTGEPIDRKEPGKWYRQALGNAEINKGARKLTVHGLRHAYNTRMRQVLTEAAIEGFWDEHHMCFANKLKSADQILKEYTGHRSTAMTDLYDHPDLLKKLKAFKMFQPYTNEFWNFEEKKEDGSNTESA